MTCHLENNSVNQNTTHICCQYSLWLLLQPGDQGFGRTEQKALLLIWCPSHNISDDFRPRGWSCLEKWWLHKMHVEKEEWFLDLMDTAHGRERKGKMSEYMWAKKTPNQQVRSDESLRRRLKHQQYQIPADKQTYIHHTWQNTKGRSLIAVSLWAHKVCDTQSRNPAETQETRAAGVDKAQWALSCPWSTETDASSPAVS